MPAISAPPRVIFRLPSPPPTSRLPLLPLRSNDGFGDDLFQRVPRLSALTPAREALLPVHESVTPAVEPYIDMRGEPVAHLRQRTHWFRGPQLKSVTPKLRSQDTSTVVVVELDNFGDIGATPLFPTPLSPAAYFVLPVGGLACLYLGAKPALEDLVDGVRNLKVLRAEGSLLRRQIDHHESQLRSGTFSWAESFTLEKRLRGLRTRLTLCQREAGNEAVDRVVGGGLIFPGATITAIGTFVTPGFITSTHSAAAATVATLFAGFVGNAPLALYGVINGVFHARRAVVAHRRLRALKGHDFNGLWHDEPTDVNALLQNRQRLMRNMALLKAGSSMGIGAGALLTAVGPFGYAILLPLTILRAATEYFGRTKLTYNRRIYDGTLEDFEPHALVNDMLYCRRTHALLKELKDKTRHAFPWGVHAPVPFNLVMRGVAMGRRLSEPEDPPPQAQLHAFLLDYSEIQRTRLDRDVRGAMLSKINLREAISADQAGPQLAVLDRQLHQTYRHREGLADDQDAMRRTQPEDLLANPHPWMARLVRFFCEAHLWPVLAEEIDKDAVLRPSLGAVLLPEDLHGRPAFHADAHSYLHKLPPFIQDPEFVAAFYALVQELLLTTVKQTFRDLQRELMDMITTQATDTVLLVA